jgi:hypothetical protein
MLSPAQAEAITRHLCDCPRCSREVDQLAEYLMDPALSTQTSLLERIKDGVRVLVARLISTRPGTSSAGRPTMALAYTGIRGEEEKSCVYQANGVQVVIGVQADTEQPGSKAILGLVTGLDPGEVEVHLWQANRLITTVLLDKLGNFVISGLASGSYELHLEGPELEIHIQDLEIGSG